MYDNPSRCARTHKHVTIQRIGTCVFSCAPSDTRTSISPQHHMKVNELQVAWFSLYQGADSFDRVALALGVLGAFSNGLIPAMFSLVFGQVRGVRSSADKLDILLPFRPCWIYCCRFCRTILSSALCPQCADRALHLHVPVRIRRSTEQGRYHR